MNKFYQNLRSSHNVIKLSISGPLTHQFQRQITSKINRIQQIKSDAILVIINSFGGSLQVGKNISARLKKLSADKQVPIYCFAEEFCLNSANLILTSGRKCFAHKFSVIGDFGYVYEGIDTTSIEQKLNIRQKHISNMKYNQQFKLNLWSESTIPQNEQLIKKLLNDSQQNLKQEILKNRQSLLLNQVQKQKFKNQLLAQGFVNPEKAVNLGLIDNVLGVEQFIIDNYPKNRVIEGQGNEFSSQWLELLRTLRESYKNRQN